MDLTEGPARGDPEVTFKQKGGHEEAGFGLLRQVVEAAKDAPIPLSGIKDAIRKIDSSFSEKSYGYRGFLQFSKAAAARGIVSMDWSEDADDYLVGPGD